MNKKKELVKNTFIILFGKICTQLISFLLLPLYTSYLITEEFGIVDLINTYVSLLVPVLSLQIEMGIFRYLIDYRNDEKEKGKLITTNFFMITKLVIISVILFITISIFLNIKYEYYIIGIVVVNMFSTNLLQIARGLGKNISYSIANVLSGVATIVLNIVLIIVFKLGARGMLIALLTSNIINFMYLFFSLKLYRYIKYENYDKNIKRKILKYSIPLIPNGVSWWIMSASDRTIISLFLGVNANGIYAVSGKFPGILTNIFNIFNLSWSESISLHINEKDKNDYISSVFNDVFNIFGSIGFLIISFMSVFFKIFIKGNYGESFLYIPILVMSSIFSLMAAQYGSIYIAKKHTKQISITTLASALINVIIHIILIKFIGLYAAALSTLLSYLIIMIYRHIDTKKYVTIKYDIFNIVRITIIYAIVVFIYYDKNSIANIISFIICILTSICLNYKYIKNIFSIIIKKIIK